MNILGIDPGPEWCGVVAYCPDRRRVTYTDTLSVMGALEIVEEWKIGHVAIERVQSYGIAGGSLLRTSEVVGKLWQAAERRGCRVDLLYRRDVLRVLDVTGKGNRDALVRQRMIEMHGGTRSAACGLKKAPGPLYGVSGHAWQALAVAVVAGELLKAEEAAP
jgi:hypothetical protein